MTRPDAPHPLEGRVEELRAQTRRLEPEVLARRTGAEYTRAAAGMGEFRLEWWGRPVSLSYPDLVAVDAAGRQPLTLLDQAILLYYFHDSDATPLAGEWIAFTELPDGGLYTQAFQGYTGQELLRNFGEDLPALSQAALASGGRRAAFADAAFIFPVLPYVALMLACWRGDEDFPPSYRILFDAAVSHHLPTEACAILGSLLTRRLLQAHSQASSHPARGKQS